MALFSLFFLAIGRARLDRDQGWGALGGSGNPCTPAEARLAPLKGHRAWGYEKSSEEPGMTQQEPVAGHAPNPTPTPISETDDSATPVKRRILVVAAIIAIPRDPSPSPSHTVAAAARAGVAGDADLGAAKFCPHFALCGAADRHAGFPRLGIDLSFGGPDRLRTRPCKCPFLHLGKQPSKVRDSRR